MRRNGEPDRIVVIGGGISGLSSAFYLLREAKRRGRDVRVTIVEAMDRVGGKINTLRRDGFVIERGPDSFLARKKPIIDLAMDLGIEQQLTGTNPAAKKTYILHRRKLHPMPQGLVLGIPTEIAPFAKTGLLSFGAKMRAMLDFVMPARAAEGDESLGSFLSRRLGPEVMERVAEPLLAGIYAGDLSKLSLQATFPQFGAAERKHGSLIRGMRANRGKTPAIAANASELPSSARTPFLTFKGGLATMVGELERALTGYEVEFRLGTKVEGIEKVEDGAKGQEQGAYRVMLDGGVTIEADGVVITTPAFHAASLLEPYVKVDAIRAVNYVSVANVVMAFDKASLGGYQFDGSGFVIPRSEGTTITACTWTSSKWLHSSPDDKVLLRCYVGRAGDEAVVDLPDAQLKEAVRADVRSIMGITAEPLFTEITRLHHSMPQYPVGHLERTAQLRAEMAKALPGVWVTGAAFDGVGLPDCIRQGKQAAVSLLDGLEG
ncbi:protoporphyrinogen oxidase [Paenibacillus methanolicus]|uniref:Coproporphyrinogen III oxidase n=1 Tax=Paenibacillus methanolicus TaxID=582686 RepID=A0A5S5C5M4_9BACL|nr:protoporphyrinogen oxidase [Paenibacillus methanolicus]TYP73898.1 oxygen-dependent protoporphyrinogen oxidase [Paenibacillus methanolicus]